MKKESYLEPCAVILNVQILDIITASDPYVNDIDWDL